MIDYNNTKGEPLVSAIIPTYNRESSVRRAIRSVVNQTYENIELIVVDDNSDYDIENVYRTLNLESLKNDRLVRHETNKGGAAARNTGINEAAGEYVAFLDDDDIWLPNKIEAQVSQLEKVKDDVAVVYTGRYICDGSGDIIDEYIPHEPKKTTQKLLCRNFVGTFSSVLIKKNALMKVNGLDESFPSWQDKDLYIRLSLYCDFCLLDEPLIVYQTENDSVTYNYDQTKNETVSLFLKKYSKLAQSFGQLFQRKMISWIHYSLGFIALNCGYYRRSFVHFTRSIVHYPFQFRFYGAILLLSYKYLNNKRK